MLLKQALDTLGCLHIIGVADWRCKMKKRKLSKGLKPAYAKQNNKMMNFEDI